ncbi:hypothetical protein APR04_005570 [Promicromonospora umidemergens]|uniref:Uncharacterized protein n=1 Tax=Promicromonospora umidemergens TaxID=629679 RepID=A0ABP8YE92_9MICO|nr:hypothetical protein [Promicromonospora umidemergens]MCP2286630.1 hypothetical protein [Promicromonospora umidemergens]
MQARRRCRVFGDFTALTAARPTVLAPDVGAPPLAGGIAQQDLELTGVSAGF